MKFIKIIVLIIGLISMTACIMQKSNNDIKVACNLPLTGDFSIYGESIKDGMMLAYDDLKDSLNKCGLNLTFDIQDNRSTAKDAQSVLRKQFMQCDIYIAGIAQPLYSILPQIGSIDIPCFAWGFEEYVLKEYNNTYRMWVNLDAEAYNYIQYIKKVGSKKVVLIRPQTVGSQLQYENKIIPFLQSNGIEYVTMVYENDKKDFKDIALKCKKEDADLYVVNGFDFHLKELLKQFKINNIMTDVNTYWSLDMLDASKNIDSITLEGVRVTAPLFLIQPNFDWIKRFEIKYNRKPRYTDAYAYDMLYTLVCAYKESKRQNTKWQNELKNISFQGITGLVKFNNNRDLEYNLKTCLYHNGELFEE